MKGRVKQTRYHFKGNSKDDSILIGNHGDAVIRIEGGFDLSGIVYNPKGTITFDIKGNGHVALRGKCFRIIIKKLTGDCTLDLRDVSCKELSCSSVSSNAVLITGKVRTISPILLHDNSVLHITENPVLLNYSASKTAKVIFENTSSEPELAR